MSARDGLLDLFKVSSEKRTTGAINKLTVGLMGIVTVLAAKLTDIGLVASVGGATFGTALVFVYPTITASKCFCHTRLVSSVNSFNVRRLRVKSAAIA